MPIKIGKNQITAQVMCKQQSVKVYMICGCRQLTKPLITFSTDIQTQQFCHEMISKTITSLFNDWISSDKQQGYCHKATATWQILGSGTDPISLLVLFFFLLLLGWCSSKKAEGSHHFRADQNEIWQDCSSSDESDFWCDITLSWWWQSVASFHVHGQLLLHIQYTAVSACLLNACDVSLCSTVHSYLLSN